MAAETKDTLSIELKPCPFCGEVENIEIDNSDTSPLTWVVCHGCGARSGLMKSVQTAMTFWNMRAEKPTE